MPGMLPVLMKRNDAYAPKMTV